MLALTSPSLSFSSNVSIALSILLGMNSSLSFLIVFCISVNLVSMT